MPQEGGRVEEAANCKLSSCHLPYITSAELDIRIAIYDVKTLPIVRGHTFLASFDHRAVGSTLHVPEPSPSGPSPRQPFPRTP